MHSLERAGKLLKGIGEFGCVRNEIEPKECRVAPIDTLMKRFLKKPF